jgi:hypothetical protein
MFFFGGHCWVERRCRTILAHSVNAALHLAHGRTYLCSADDRALPKQVAQK